MSCSWQFLLSQTTQRQQGECSGSTDENVED